MARLTLEITSKKTFWFYVLKAILKLRLCFLSGLIKDKAIVKLSTGSKLKVSDIIAI